MPNTLTAENQTMTADYYWNTDIFVYFTSYENHIACGVVKLLYLENMIDFQGLGHLLLLIDDVMDFINLKRKDAHYPQATFARRNLAIKKKEVPPNIYNFDESKLATNVSPPIPRYTGKEIAFAVISVRYRQHTSIQGVLKVSGIEMPFRSGMELLRLLYQLLETQ